MQKTRNDTYLLISSHERALELDTLNSENGNPVTLQVDEVRKELANINPKKAPGPDKIIL